MAASQATCLEASVAALRALVPIILPMATGDEVLARFHALDAHATSGEPRVDVLPPSLRDRAVRHMERMLHLLGCEPAFLFKAVTLLDAWHARTGILQEDLLAAMAAAVGIAAKDCGSAKAVDLRALAEQAGSAAPSVAVGGVERSEVTPAAVRRAERQLLMALEWSVHLPTLSTWTNLALARLDRLTGGAYRAQLAWLHSAFAAHVTRLLLLRRAACSGLTTGHAVAGVLGCGLLAAGALSATSLALTDSQCVALLGVCAGPHRFQWTTLSNENQAQLVRDLAEATGCSEETLRAASSSVAGDIVNATADARRRFVSL